MNCKKFETWMLSRNAHFDDNVPLAENSHLKECPQCHDIFEADNALESQISDALSPSKIPEGLTNRIDKGLDSTGSSLHSLVKKSAAAALVGLVLIVTLVYSGFFNQSPRFQTLQQLGESVTAQHLDKNMQMTFQAEELDQAMVMLSKTLRFNVIIPDLSKQGFVLLGGRICKVNDCQSAYLLYKNNGKIASLFIMDYALFDFTMADGSRFSNEIKGLKTDIWKNNSQVYAMVY